MAKQAVFPRRLENAEKEFGELTVILAPSLHASKIHKQTFLGFKQFLS